MIIHEQLMTPFHKIMFDMIRFFLLTTFWPHFGLWCRFCSPVRHIGLSPPWLQKVKPSEMPQKRLMTLGQQGKKTEAAGVDVRIFFFSEEAQPLIKVKFFCE